MEILKANLNDLKEITNIYINVFSSPPRNEVLNFDEVYNTLAQHMKHGVFFIAKKDHKILGFKSLVKQNILHDYYDVKKIFISNNFYLNDDSYYSSESAVLSEFRGLGIWQLLHNHILNWAKDYTNVIYSRCRTDAPEIIHLLEKNDFKRLFYADFTINGVTSKKIVFEFKFN